MRSYTETVENLNKMIPEIHRNAVEHGWWDEDRSESEIYALIHSELSEALEEYRDNKPDVYCCQHGSDWCHICYGDTCEINPDIDCVTCFAQREESGKVPNKPEGVIVELADAVIRIMDYLGKGGYTFNLNNAIYSNVGLPLRTNENCSDLIVCAHAALSQAFIHDYICWIQDPEHNEINKESEIATLSAVVKWINEYAAGRGYDLVSVVRMKHAYNITRPYKHGGKRI